MSIPLWILILPSGKLYNSLLLKPWPYSWLISTVHRKNGDFPIVLCKRFPEGIYIYISDLTIKWGSWWMKIWPSINRYLFSISPIISPLITINPPYVHYIYWLVLEPSLWKIDGVRQSVGNMKFPTEWKNKIHVPNHQPVINDWVFPKNWAHWFPMKKMTHIFGMITWGPPC